MSGARHQFDGSCGLNETETAVMALWESGKSREAIAAALGLKAYRVVNIVSLFDVGRGELSSWERMVRAGDARYQAALAASGGTYR